MLQSLQQKEVTYLYDSTTKEESEGLSLLNESLLSYSSTKGEGDFQLLTKLDFLWGFPRIKIMPKGKSCKPKGPFGC